MTTIVDVLNARYASRSISSEPIAQKTIDGLVEAIRLTPSCYNNQPWRYIFLSTPDSLALAKDFMISYNYGWAAPAPLIVIGYSKKEDDCVLNDGRAYHEFDLGMATMSLMLAATEHDLVARPMAGFKPDKIAEMFELPQGSHALIVLAIGKYNPDESHLPEKLRGANKVPRERKSASEIIRFM